MIFSRRLISTLEKRKFTKKFIKTASATSEICTRVIAEITSTPRVITSNISPIPNIKKELSICNKFKYLLETRYLNLLLFI